MKSIACRPVLRSLISDPLKAFQQENSTAIKTKWFGSLSKSLSICGVQNFKYLLYIWGLARFCGYFFGVASKLDNFNEFFLKSTTGTCGL